MRSSSDRSLSGLLYRCLQFDYLRLSESKEKEQFTELPLCLIRQKYDGVAGGKAFVDNLIASYLASKHLLPQILEPNPTGRHTQTPQPMHIPGQTGKKHPQSDDKEMRLYKIFDSIKSSSA